MCRGSFRATGQRIAVFHVRSPYVFGGVRRLRISGLTLPMSEVSDIICFGFPDFKPVKLTCEGRRKSPLPYPQPRHPCVDAHLGRQHDAAIVVNLDVDRARHEGCFQLIAQFRAFFMAVNRGVKPLGACHRIALGMRAAGTVDDDYAGAGPFVIRRDRLVQGCGASGLGSIPEPCCLPSGRTRP